MPQVGSAKVNVQKLSQAGFVVRNLQQVMENYWNILGIGPWDIFEWEAPLVYDRRYHGNLVWARDRIAVTWLGELQLELCQPVEGNSIYQDWIDEHGDGFHHLNFWVDDIDGIAEILAGQGFPVIQSGRYGPREANCGFKYIDTTKPLRTIWEPVHPGEKPGAKHSRYPEDPAEKSPARVKIKEANKVTIAVKDLQQVTENYQHILGIGPWDVLEWETPLVYDRKYHGNPAWAREKVARAQVGGVKLELCQYVDGDSVYNDFLKKHGEVLHHVSFLVDNVEKTVEALAELGFPSIQSGRFGTDKRGCAYHYVDIEPLCAVFEITNDGGK
ncbi:VOC family protein [Chloroflexota bacterium]